MESIEMRNIVDAVRAAEWLLRLSAGRLVITGCQAQMGWDEMRRLQACGRRLESVRDTLRGVREALMALDV